MTLLPVSNIISIGAFLGERFLYLPSISVALLAVGVFYHTQKTTPLLSRASTDALPLPLPGGEGRGEGARLTLSRCALVGFVLISALFAFMTFNRNYDWKNANTLWEKVLLHQPDNPRANFHLAVKYDEQQHYPSALSFYEKDIR